MIDLTKRELFIALAMHGLLACPDLKDSRPEAVAKFACACADAVLKQMETRE